MVAPEQVEAEALAAAHDLATRLKPRPFRQTRQNARVATARRVQAGLDQDIAAVTVEG